MKKELIKEFLKERILFAENYIKNENSNSANKIDFVVAKSQFKECLIAYEKHINDKTSIVKRRDFINRFVEIIQRSISELDMQQHRVIYVYGVPYCTNEKLDLPEDVTAKMEQRRVYLEKTYNYFVLKTNFRK
jgi:hypothetical protein